MRAARLLARLVQKPLLIALPWAPAARLAERINATLVFRTPPGLTITPLGPRMVRVGPERRGRLIYIHGGGFVIGSLRTYRGLVFALAEASGLTGTFVDYRLAPEHPFPAALDDVTAAYRAALDAGVPAGEIALAGDSAGGALTLALLHRLRREGLPLPGAAAVFSPIVDLDPARPVPDGPVDDPLVSPIWGIRGVRAYLGAADPADPEVSPIRGSLNGFPPVAVHWDAGEYLAEDARRLVAGLEAAGVTVEPLERSSALHAWHVHVGRVPEADADVAAAGAFLARHTAAAAPLPAAPAGAI